MKYAQTSVTLDDATILQALERKCEKDVVHEAWVKLFTQFSDLTDLPTKKKVINIKRQDVKGEIKDILHHMKKLDATDHNVKFCMPWDFTRISIDSDSENIQAVSNEVNNKMVNERINNLEKRMNDNHNILLKAISCGKPEAPQQSLVEAQLMAAATWPQLSLTAPSASIATALPEGSATPGNWADLGARPRVPANGVPDGGRVQTERIGGGGSKAPSSKGRNGGQTVVSGTGPSDGVTRKMKAAPADIFVWGIHPDISVNDIVEDLKTSDIDIKPEDIVCKTRVSDEQKQQGHLPLDCYKITVKSEDLEKVMKSEVWPARVKVRQWIHYPKNSSNAKVQSRTKIDPRDRRDENQAGRHRGPVTGRDGFSSYSRHASPAVDALLDPHNLLSHNRYYELGSPLENSAAQVPLTRP